MPHEPALLTSEAMDGEAQAHRESEGQNGRSERPATGYG